MTWKMPKKVWCCLLHHLGCPSTPMPPQPIFRPPVPVAPPPAPVVPPPAPVVPPPAPVVPVLPVTTSCPYDYNAGFSNWEKGWPAGKKNYCCRTTQKGCPPTPPPGPTTSL